MSSFKELFESDMHRYAGNESKYCRLFSYYLRRCYCGGNRLLHAYYRLRFKYISRKNGLEIPWKTVIGKGLYLGHPYNITVNQNAVIGKNVNLHKGVTIGKENRGARKGAPTLMDNVWVGINSTIVGKVTIGNDVLIAPNSFVNCDVPPHSIVMGSPCRIIPRENATECYIVNTVE